MTATKTRKESGQESGVTIGDPSLGNHRGFRAPGTARMIGGSLVGAIAAYLFQVVGGRRLGTEAFSPIAVLWTVFFIVATIMLIPLEQFVTREAGRGRRVLVEDRRVLAVVIGGTALSLGAFVLLMRDRLFAGDPVFALQAFLMIAMFGVMQVGKGVLAGHRHFATYGLVLALEGVIRLTAAVAVLAVSASPQALGWAMVSAPLCVFLVRPWRFDRETVEGVDATPARGFLSSYAVGSSASQLLLAGAPLGVAALGGGEHLRSVVFATFTLYRAPLTLIYNLQGRVLSLLVRLEDQTNLRVFIKRIVTVGIGLVAAAALVGWAAGPAVVQVLFGVEFRPIAAMAAMAAAGMIAASITQVLSQALVASGSTGELAGAWVGGLVAGITAMLVTAGPPEIRVAVGFVVGELVALGLAVWRASRRTR